MPGVASRQLPKSSTTRPSICPARIRSNTPLMSSMSFSVITIRSKVDVSYDPPEYSWRELEICSLWISHGFTCLRIENLDELIRIVIVIRTCKHADDSCAVWAEFCRRCTLDPI